MILYNKEKGSLWISRPGIYNSIYTSERSEREIFGVFRCWNGHFFDKCCRYIKHFVGTPRKLCRTNIPVHQAPTTSLRWNSPDWLISPEYFANWGGRGPPGPPFGHATVSSYICTYRSIYIYLYLFINLTLLLIYLTHLCIYLHTCMYTYLYISL